MSFLNKLHNFLVADAAQINIKCLKTMARAGEVYLHTLCNGLLVKWCSLKGDE